MFSNTEKRFLNISQLINKMENEKIKYEIEYIRKIQAGAFGAASMLEKEARKKGVELDKEYCFYRAIVESLERGDTEGADKLFKIAEKRGIHIDKEGVIKMVYEKKKESLELYEKYMEKHGISKKGKR